MNKVLDKLPALVAEELEAANAENPPFHSLHEGWAVMREELEETREALVEAEVWLKRAWDNIRIDRHSGVHQAALKIEWYAMNAAAEAIQVAAMAHKLLDYLEEVKKDA